MRDYGLYDSLRDLEQYHGRCEECNSARQADGSCKCKEDKELMAMTEEELFNSIWPRKDSLHPEGF